ncbi:MULTISPECIES: methionyl-tRNA formyltransferase [unclassified Peribacillus]|uniref:methionyl-tRNA formyltransferase n=1 Tax=unclassified Peribacillus TaxID=2675266 RepID=UPI00191392D6|nr:MULTISPECIES: methionyl-tRNA formyltransferase [unclassified Peribacillus]MBK5445849.1 methionyl-tRNA formyltransferase [Peribacillus sp. TH24]MBK5459437.1 methionyl-tRNA formyltransferase [Peribacillus sp. TH27]MBK5497626.1 methionyl-tRNA formyltransferase [Peribacillus sp. TH14]
MTKIIFMGTPDFSVPVLKRILDEGYDVIAVVTQPDRPVGRKKVLTPPPVKVEAEKQGIPVYQPEKIREKEDLEKIIALKPDLVVTAAFGQILPNELLEAPKYGCINVHASLLPELRGGAPIHYSILQGKEKTGITIMYMAEKLDAGDILTQAEVTIEEEDNVGTLHDKLSKVGSDLLAETLPKLINDELNAIKQDEDKATFAPNIRRTEEKIDWSKTGEDIYNHVRGLNPWPVAYTLLNESILKIWQANKLEHNNQAVPGTIIDVRNDGFVVSTGNETAILVTELQPSGKKKMPAKDYLRGAGSFIKAGMKLGEQNEAN